MANQTEQMAKNTLELRRRIHHRMATEGLTESQALAKEMPDDANRTKKLRKWKERGLWPLSGFDTTGHEPVSVSQASAAKEEGGQGIPPEIMQYLNAMEERLVEMIHGAAKAEPAEETTAVDEPPIPAKTGKKYQGSKKDLRVRIDERLMDLLEKEAKQNHGGNNSRALDVILWRYFGKPRLSFEPETEQAPPRE